MVKKTQPGDRVARFLNPLVAAKDIEHANGKKSQRFHCSFQSTLSCNTSTVNALNECGLFIEVCERGRGQNKRFWAIEMNDARRFYLRADIKNTRIFYRCWKY